MSKSLLILTPNPEHPSHHGRWPYVLDGYREALAGVDVEVFDQPWSKPVERDYDLIVPLVAWGYHNDPDGFSAAMARLQADGRKVMNPAEIVAWNVDKRYLRDLAEGGVRIIPTMFVERLTESAIAQARADFDQALVIKPVVSAGAKNTVVWREDGVPPVAGDGAEPAVKGDISKTAPSGPAMIQPFMESVQSEGEWSLLYFAGEFSHAVLKTPKAGDFRSQPDYDAELRALEPPEEALALAEATVGYVGRDRLLYARVDMVRDDAGRFCLMELELIEPDLYLGNDLEAQMRFKDAVEATLHVGCGCHG